MPLRRNDWRYVDGFIHRLHNRAAGIGVKKMLLSVQRVAPDVPRRICVSLKGESCDRAGLGGPCHRSGNTVHEQREAVGRRRHRNHVRQRSALNRASSQLAVRRNPERIAVIVRCKIETEKRHVRGRYGIHRRAADRRAVVARCRIRKERIGVHRLRGKLRYRRVVPDDVPDICAGRRGNVAADEYRTMHVLPRSCPVVYCGFTRESGVADSRHHPSASFRAFVATEYLGAPVADN